MDTLPVSGPDGGGAPEVPPLTLPSLPVRLVQLFVSPGQLTRALAAHPVWGAAMALGAILVVLQVALIPVGVWEAQAREAAMQRGAELPSGMEAAAGFIRVFAVLGGAGGQVVMTFVMAGIVTLVFAFLLGDEGRYRQYLAVTAHAWVIPALVAFLLLPLKIAQQDVQFSLSLGSFLFFLPDGYPLRVATFLDLSMGWAWLVVAQGACAIDPRRSFAGAAGAAMAIFLATALLLGLIPGVG